MTTKCTGAEYKAFLSDLSDEQIEQLAAQAGIWTPLTDKAAALVKLRRFAELCGTRPAVLGVDELLRFQPNFNLEDNEPSLREVLRRYYGSTFDGDLAEQYAQWYEASLRASLPSAQQAAPTPAARPAVLGVDELHAKLINLPCSEPADFTINERRGYRVGHRDACHAAAELASSLASSAHQPTPEFLESVRAMADRLLSGQASSPNIRQAALWLQDFYLASSAHAESAEPCAICKEADGHKMQCPNGGWSSPVAVSRVGDEFAAQQAAPTPTEQPESGERSLAGRPLYEQWCALWPDAEECAPPQGWGDLPFEHRLAWRRLRNALASQQQPPSAAPAEPTSAPSRAE